MEKRVIICSDVHLCHIDWYGVSCEERLERMVAQLNEYYEKNSYEKIIFLGDYSLDFWAWDIGGSYVREGLSNTSLFIEKFASELKAPYYMLPGNHEQYSYKKWKEITGSDREDAFVLGGYLFISCDTFSGELDPDYHTDGTYVPVNLDFVKQKLCEHPDLPVILCSHWFDTEKEPPEFFEFIKTEKRITGLFEGHDHKCTVTDLGERADNVCIYHDGHFSYSGGTLEEQMWGFCDVILGEKGVNVKYVEPENMIIENSVEKAYPLNERNLLFMPRRDI